MLPYRTFGPSRGVGLPARSCPSVVLLPAGAGGELPRPPEWKMEEPATCRATELLPLQTQAKTLHASQAWRNIRPRGVKARLSPSQAAERLSALVVNSLM